MEGRLSLAAYIKIFVAMIVIVNPLGIMPVFVAMTALQNDFERKRQRNESRVAPAGGMRDGDWCGTGEMAGEPHQC